MGGQGSGNFGAKERANPKDKSINKTVRLNPRKDKHRWAKDYIEDFLRQQAPLPEDQRWSLGDLIAEALMVYAGVERDYPTVTASAADVVSIKQIVEYIMDGMEQGRFAANGGGGSKRRKAVAPTIYEGMRATVAHYMSTGFTGDDALDED